MMERVRNAVVASLVTAMIAGCADMGGNSTQAITRDANALAATRSLAGTTLSAAAWPTSDWWKAFNDPQLDQLMQEALADSPTLKVAAARTRKALAFSDSAKAALYPQIDGNLAITEQRFSETRTVSAALRRHVEHVQSIGGQPQLGNRFLGQEPLRV